MLMTKEERQRNRRARLAQILNEEKAVDIAKKAGTDEAYLSQLKTGVKTKKGTIRSITDDMAERLEKAFGKQSGWMDTNPHTATAPTTNNVTNIADKLLQSPNDDLFVPISDATASMGNGKAVLSHEIVIGHLKVSRQWIRNTLSISKPDNLAVITAFGDSMAPTFSDGDTLLIDRGVNKMKVDAVYVIAMNDELFVKRVQRRMDGALVIKSDNPLYDPYIVENGDKDGLDVLGRVAWVWNGKKL